VLSADKNHSHAAASEKVIVAYEKALAYTPLVGQALGSMKFLLCYLQNPSTTMWQQLSTDFVEHRVFHPRLGWLL
jgi:hypothetical protein